MSFQHDLLLSTISEQLQWTLALTTIVFNKFLVILNKFSLVLHFWLQKLIQIPNGLTKTIFNNFLILNKNLGFLLKFHRGFREQYIFELQSLFATFESMETVEFVEFHFVISLWRRVISFEYIKLSENNFSFPNTFWKVRI